MNQYKDRHVLITGASRGIGAQLVKCYLDRGIPVIGCSRGHHTVTHPKYLHFIADIVDENSVSEMFIKIRDMKANVYLLINCAGIAQSSLGIYTTSKLAKEIIDVNLLGNFLVSREALKLMYKFGVVRIINLSSINVPLTSVGSSIYNASKAAVDVLAKTLAIECGSMDITINTLGISLVRNSGMYASLSEGAIRSKQERLIKPEPIECSEIFSAINYFSSEDAKNVSGQILYFGGVS